MGDAITIIAVSSGAFIGTNLDNLVLLVALYSRFRNNSKSVTAGYVSGMILIGIICLIIGLGGVFIPISYLGMLGVIPIFLGIIALLQLFWANQGTESSSVRMETGSRAIFTAVLLTQLSNGADSIITFSVFLADSTPKSDYLIVLTFLAMTLIFSGVAFYSLIHRKLSNFLNRYGKYVTPFILIFVGFYIISNTATDLVPG
jgi:cadmium resistance protein CadD (predicted permease)